MPIKITESMRIQFRRDGMLILKQVVPPDRLESVRASTNTVVDRARAADPIWDTNPIPRAQIGSFCDRNTRSSFAFALHANTLGVSAQILDCPVNTIGVNMISVLCNPQFEPHPPSPSGQPWGTDPRNWHRDVRPDHDGPLSELIADQEANGPGYVQWNIALLDEAILNVVPGSHRRLNSELEMRQLNLDGGTMRPLDGSIAVDLKAGDGVVYNPMLLHWGSRYTSHQKRRTLLFSYRSFGRMLPYPIDTFLSEDVCRLLDGGQRDLLDRSLDLYRQEYVRIEVLFGAVIAGDRGRFQANLQKLHPASEGRLTCLIILTRMARQLEERRRSDAKPKAGPVSLSIALQSELLAKLSAADLDRLWARFERFDALLRADEATHVRGFLGKPTKYHFERLPAGVTLDRAVAAIMDEADSDGPTGAG